MTKDRLEQYRNILAEIKLLEYQLKASMTQGPDYVSDTVSSAAEFPYSKHTVKIDGYDWSRYQDRNGRIRDKLTQRQQAAQAEREAIEDYISGIDDSLVRQAISLKYIEGLKWWQVAQRIGGGNSEESIKQAVSRYIRNQ